MCNKRIPLTCGSYDFHTHQDRGYNIAVASRFLAHCQSLSNAIDRNGSVFCDVFDLTKHLGEIQWWQQNCICNEKYLLAVWFHSFLFVCLFTIFVTTLIGFVPSFYSYSYKTSTYCYLCMTMPSQNCNAKSSAAAEIHVDQDSLHSTRQRQTTNKERTRKKQNISSR